MNQEERVEKMIDEVIDEIRDRLANGWRVESITRELYSEDILVFELGMVKDGN